jgi:hypothetical protein
MHCCGGGSHHQPHLKRFILQLLCHRCVMDVEQGLCIMLGRIGVRSIPLMDPDVKR